MKVIVPTNEIIGRAKLLQYPHYAHHSSDEAKADCFDDYFASISSVNDEHIRLPTFEPKTNSKLSSITIEESEIKDITENLDPDKAIGPDFISNKMLIGTAHAVLKHLSILYNRILHDHSFPSPCKKSPVLPVYKNMIKR